jgi:hypothetical protein
MNSTETIADRFELARGDVTPARIVAGLAFGAAIAFALLFLQEPLAHDSMHNFRHAVGIVCH